VDVQSRCRRGRRLIAPHPVEERIGIDRNAGVEQKYRQQASLCRAQGQRNRTLEQLEWPQRADRASLSNQLPALAPLSVAERLVGV
jgi:hypothetical protein